MSQYQHVTWGILVHLPPGATSQSCMKWAITILSNNIGALFLRYINSNSYLWIFSCKILRRFLTYDPVLHITYINVSRADNRPFPCLLCCTQIWNLKVNKKFRHDLENFFYSFNILSVYCYKGMLGNYFLNKWCILYDISL
jgi:hypothetical protein